MAKKDKDVNNWSIGGLVFIGCLFLGTGIGMIYDQRNIGGAIGMGAGFLGMGIVLYLSSKKD